MPGGPIFNCYPGPFSNVRCISRFDFIPLVADLFNIENDLNL